MTIRKAECFEFRPKDRNYNKHGKPMQAQMEILGDGLCYCLRTEFVYGVIIEEEDDETEEKH